MGFAEAIRTCFQKYVTFSGRASRPEFWYFAAVFTCAFILTFWNMARVNGPINSELSTFSLTMLVLGIPLLAVATRRSHDIGKSGVFAILPILGLGVWMTINVALGLYGIARYGSNPKEGTVPDGLFEAISIASFLAAFILPSLFVAYMLAKRSNPNSNKYGPNPSEVTR